MRAVGVAAAPALADQPIEIVGLRLSRLTRGRDAASRRRPQARGRGSRERSPSPRRRRRTPRGSRRARSVRDSLQRQPAGGPARPGGAAPRPGRRTVVAADDRFSDRNSIAGRTPRHRRGRDRRRRAVPPGRRASQAARIVAGAPTTSSAGSTPPLVRARTSPPGSPRLTSPRGWRRGGGRGRASPVAGRPRRSERRRRSARRNRLESDAATADHADAIAERTGRRGRPRRSRSRRRTQQRGLPQRQRRRNRDRRLGGHDRVLRKAGDAQAC